MAQVALGGLRGKQQAALDNEQQAQQNETEALRGYTEAVQATKDAYAPILGQISNIQPDQRGGVIDEYSNRILGLGSQFAGHFRPTSPLGQFFRQTAQAHAQGLPQLGAQPGAQPGMQPAPQPGMQTGGLPGGPPFGAPLEGGMPTPSAFPTGGGPLTGPVRPPATLTTPGGFTATLGPDRAQVSAVQNEVQRLAGAFSGKEVPPETTQQAVGLIGSVRASLDRGDLDTARAQITQLQQLEAQIGPQRKEAATREGAVLATRHDRAIQNLRKQPLQGPAAFAALSDLQDMERRGTSLQQQYPDQVAGMTDLQPYSEELQEMQQARQQEIALAKPVAGETPDQKAAREQQRDHYGRLWRGRATDVYDALRSGVGVAQQQQVIDRAMNTIRPWVAMLPPEQRTPENIAGLLQQRGLTAEAQYVLDHKLNFGGEQAEKNTLSLLSRLPQVVKSGNPALIAPFVNEIRAQSALTGQPVRLSPDQLLMPDKSDVPGSKEYLQKQKLMLEIDKMRRDKVAELPGGTKFQMQHLDLAIKQAKVNETTGQLPDPNLIRGVTGKRLSQAQHDADHAWTLYNNYLQRHPAVEKAGFDPEYWLSQPPQWRQQHPIGDQATQEAVNLFGNWRQAVNKQDALFKPENVRKAQAELRQGLGGQGGGQQNTGRSQQRQQQSQAGGGGMKTITVGGQQVQVDPAKLIAGMKQRGWSDQQIQQKRAADGW